MKDKINTSQLKMIVLVALTEQKKLLRSKTNAIFQVPTDSKK